jgi:hypothetical protein
MVLLFKTMNVPLLFFSAGGGGVRRWWWLWWSLVAATQFVALPQPLVVEPEEGKLLVFHNCLGTESRLCFTPPGGWDPAQQPQPPRHCWVRV